MTATTSPYSVLAGGYDVIMDHVDYVGWVKYIDSLLQLHGGSPKSVIEYACGTGSFAVLFNQLYEVPYLATDGSEEMIRVAREKIHGSPEDRSNILLSLDTLDFLTVDFLNESNQEPFDLALLLYDGLNYVTSLRDVARLFQVVSETLVPGGRFIFDQATPENSIQNASLFEDSGSCDAFDFVRKSRYDSSTGLHETVFQLETRSGSYTETHVQRPYRFSEIRDILIASPLEPIAAYEDFSLKQVDDTAERIDTAERLHWVVRRPL